LSSWLSVGPEELLARLAAGLADPSARAWPPFVSVVERTDELVVVVHGPVEVRADIDGHEHSLTGGDDVGSWVSRAFTGARSLSVPAGDDRPGTEGPEGLVNLGAGLLRAGGFVFYPSPSLPSASVPEKDAFGTGPDRGQAAPTAERQEHVVALTEAPEAGADAELARTVALPAGTGNYQGSAGAAPEGATVADLGAGAGDVTVIERPSGNGAGWGPTNPALRTSPTGPLVRGTYCPAGHFNDPRHRACRRCGARLPAGPLAEGQRPPLGFLTWDDGVVSELGPGALVGREVAGDKDVQAGRLRPVTPTGTNDSMSRVHAEVRAVGWDVTITDRGSTNGTFVWDDVTKSWLRMVPGEPQVVPPGTVLAFGERTATFDI
jgi:hypothetical protein